MNTYDELEKLFGIFEPKAAETIRELKKNGKPFTAVWWQEVGGFATAIDGSTSSWVFCVATHEVPPPYPVENAHVADTGLWNRLLTKAELEFIEKLGVGSPLHPARAGRLVPKRKIEDYKDIHKGSHCFILGNGSSLNKVDLSKLDTQITFGMNRTVDRYRTTYYCALDDVWLPNCPYPDDRIFTHPNRWNRGVIVKAHPVYTHWSKDLSEGAAYSNTGLLAMQIAVWMGCEPIYLLGFDGRSAHFDNTPSKILSQKMTTLLRTPSKEHKIYTCVHPDDSDIMGLKYVPLEEAIAGQQ